MIIIGLLLLIAAIIFGGEFVFANHHHFANPAVFGQKLGLSNDASIFVVGAITGAAVLLGLALIVLGTRRKAANAVTHRHQRRAAEGARNERDDLVDENAALRRQLALERAADLGRNDAAMPIPAPYAETGGATRVDVEAVDSPGTPTL